MAITLKDIARECGLAVSTVSNILNNNGTSFASQEVRTRVRETAARLGYKKDYLSSSLRTRTTRSVGLILDQIDDVTRQDFLVPFVEGFSRAGYEVALTEHRDEAGRAAAALAGFAERCKDAVVLFTDLLGRSEADQAALTSAVANSGLKVLGIGSRMRGLVPSIDIDRGGCVETSIDYLLTRTAKDVLVVYEYDYDMRPRFGRWDHPRVTYWSGIHRFEDFQARVAAEGLDRFGGVFFRTDKVAIPAMKEIRSRGLRVPEDLEVLSFDNFLFTQHTSPALSTWDIGFHRIGIRAQELTSAWLTGFGPAADFYELYRPVFVGRESHGGTL